MNILTRDRLAVRADGEIVVIRVGAQELCIGYEDALDLSQWIRVRAKEAKKNAGDVSRTWRLCGVLEDLTRTKG